MAGEYRIVRVDGEDEDVADTLANLDALCFPDGSGGQLPNFSKGNWWMVLSRGEVVGYAGLTQSSWHHTAAYLKRVGVHPAHRGAGLQHRLIDVRVRAAQREGYGLVITDCTTCNPSSANSLIKRGFRVFMPRNPWALESSIYWKKDLQS